MQKWTASGTAGRRPTSPQSPPPSAVTIRPSGRRQRAGFDDARPGSASSMKRAAQSRPRLTTWDDDDAVGIPMIPDLEEVMEEDLALQVAPAPSAPVNRVATMQELNDELQKKPGFLTLDGLDLHLLSRCVQERHEVDEPDRPWQWDVLFTELLSDTQDDSCTELLLTSPDPTPQSSSGTLKGSSTDARSPRRASRTQANPAAATSRV